MAENIIYGVKTGDTYHYIGKTSKKANAGGNLKRSKIQTLYHKDSIRKVFNDNTFIDIVPLSVVGDDEWFDEKLVEVVKKHKDKQPLLNAQWMLDGKRGVFDGTQGYWIGKTRDANTLLKLSESKYKQVVQYDINGNLIKIWDSIKEAATMVFKDYKIIKGSGCSLLYSVLSGTKLSTKLRHGSYWFGSDELTESFGVIPTRLKLDVMYENEKIRRKAVHKTHKTHTSIMSSIYTVNQFNDKGVLINKFANVYEAAYLLNLSVKQIQRVCNGIKIREVVYLKYGEKTRQPYNQEKIWKVS
jgi:hypothetical protein